METKLCLKIDFKDIVKKCNGKEIILFIFAFNSDSFAKSFYIIVTPSQEEEPIKNSHPKNYLLVKGYLA